MFDIGIGAGIDVLPWDRSELPLHQTSPPPIDSRGYGSH